MPTKIKNVAGIVYVDKKVQNNDIEIRISDLDTPGEYTLSLTGKVARTLSNKKVYESEQITLIVPLEEIYEIISKGL